MAQRIRLPLLQLSKPTAAVLSFVLCLAASVAGNAAQSHNNGIQLNFVDDVVLRGELGQGEVAAPGGVVYPADGFLVGLVVHALLERGSSSAKAAKLRTEADAVLQEFELADAQLWQHSLYQSALAHYETIRGSYPQPLPLINASEPSYTMQLQPVITVAQNLQQLNVQVELAIENSAGEQIYAKRMTIYTAPKSAEQPADQQWLLAEFGNLLAQLVCMAVYEMSYGVDTSAVYETKRVEFAGSVQVERGRDMFFPNELAVFEGLDRGVVAAPRALLRDSPL